MPRYKVMVDDNFHYQKEDERTEQGVYNTLQEAVVVCRGIVDKSLEEGYRPGISAKELYDLYVSFGEDPFIVALDGADEPAEFSAWSYAKERCQIICQKQSPMPQAAAKEPAGELRKILGRSQNGQAPAATLTAPTSVSAPTLDDQASTPSQISERGKFTTVQSTITAKLKRCLGLISNLIACLYREPG
jgi:hypothetical protein